MIRPIRICIVAPGHLASSPRVVKEADALHGAGYAVTVIASDHYAPVRALDQTILTRAPWDHVLLRPSGSRAAGAARKLRREACRRLIRAGFRHLSIAVRANDGRHGEFVRAALAVRADLYIGHTLAGLAAAAEAAQGAGARLGFDAEDWHRQEQAESERPGGLTRAIELIEDALVPRCAHLTAASPLIGREYAALGRRTPVTLLNVFPIGEAPPAPVPLSGSIDAVYWFSQTIGPDRGLESILRAVALLPAHWEVHLRGTPAPGYGGALGSLARSLGMEGRVKWLPPAPPDRMAALSSGYSAGLSVELTEPRNRGLCLTNKIFTYLLAGTPVLLSDTPAHRLLAPDLGIAARVADIGRPRDVADAVLSLRSEAARDHAWLIARQRYNWETESRALLEAVRLAMGAPAA
jgi:glycosyltransferase involved in cell wall biosynthesis